jgi:hypothetical protein
MGWMGLSLRVRILSIIAILLALALVAIASWENARGALRPKAFQAPVTDGWVA